MSTVANISYPYPYAYPLVESPSDYFEFPSGDLESNGYEDQCDDFNLSE